MENLEKGSRMATKAQLRAALPKITDTWLNLPVAIKNGIGVQVENFVYVGLGSAGTDLYALDLEDRCKGWQKRAAFTGPSTNSAAAAASGGNIFVFSGNGKATPEARSPVILDSVHMYDTAKDCWSRVETRTPAGLSGASALSLQDGRIALVGGYNKDLFDKYLAAIAALDKDEHPAEFARLVKDYMSMEPRDYKWNSKVLVYDPVANSWGCLGENPFPPNCDSAVSKTGPDSFVVVGGEIKPGLRTPATKRISFKGNTCAWQRLADLPKPAGDHMQEGLAGAFAGYAGNCILVAGGVNFKGARKNAAAGQWYAHEGLAKKWRDEVYCFDGTNWHEVGRLPWGLGYGVSFAVPEGVLIVGGEDSEGKARTEVFVIEFSEERADAGRDGDRLEMP